MILVAQLYDLLQAAGLNGVFAGGSARAVVFGEEPKDYDYVLLGNFSYDEAMQCVTYLPEVTIRGTHPENYSNSPRFNWCINLSIKGHQVDLIGTKLAPDTAEDVIDGFDFGINHCYFDPDGKVVLGNKFPSPGDKVIVLSDSELRSERAFRFAERYPQFDWSDVLAAATSGGSGSV